MRSSTLKIHMKRHGHYDSDDSSFADNSVIDEGSNSEDFSSKTSTEEVKRPITDQSKKRIDKQNHKTSGQ